ncbi:MAG: polymer-forming cytoskeletal protein [Saprospiraceae bacterium]|nr:polymer-forming cytoskeletal protein [Saprospiraceae bacterium]
MIATAIETSKQLTKTVSLSPSLVTTTASTNSSAIGCVIADGTHIEGMIKTKENIRLDGELTGTISCEQRLVIGMYGRANGTVWAKEADISGTIDGDIEVTQLLILRRNCVIRGVIKAKAVQVEEGAIYEGKCLIG